MLTDTPFLAYRSRKIPQILESPVLVMESRNTGRGKKDNTRLVMFGTVKAKDGLPVLVALDMRPKEKHLVIEGMQKVTSAYTKDNNPVDFLQKSNVMYVDKKRTTSLLRTIGFQMPIELNESGYIGNITYQGQNVKLFGKPFGEVVDAGALKNNRSLATLPSDDKILSQTSETLSGTASKDIISNPSENTTDFTKKYQDRDSEGNELSKNQIKYFKNSKVRDDKGRLIPLYHQTDNEFTVFDVKKQGAGASDNETPFGIFLKSSDKDIGLNGKKQMKLYANITNPLYANNRSELKERLVSLSPSYAELIKKHQGLDSLYKEKFERAKKELIEYMTSWRKQNPNASRTALYDDQKFNEIYNAEDAIIEEWGNEADNLTLEAKEAIFKALKNAGYDGIILKKDEGSFGRTTDAYIALDPNQVKEVTNKTPTENPDIRYQDRINMVEELSTYNLEGKWNDYIGVQKEVIGVLKEEGYFEDNQVTNASTGMIIRINPKGIKETLGTGKRFQSLPKKLKEFKIATIRSLPRIIETATLVADNVPNKHKENGYEFAYFSNTIQIGSDNVRVRLSVKKKIGTNLFWMHNIDEINKSSELLDPSQEMELKETQNFDSKITHDEDSVNLYFSDRFDNEFFELFAEDNTVEKESKVLGDDLVRLAELTDTPSV